MTLRSRFWAVAALLALLGTPGLSCFVPQQLLSASENECCRQMGSQCGSKEMSSPQSCCKSPTQQSAQLYIGGFFRTTGATTAAAVVTATVPAALTDMTGDSIPFSQINWTSSGIADPPTEPFPAGTFVSGGVQTVGSMASNTWNESCWTFSYLNTKVAAAGTYTGAVLTVSANVGDVMLVASADPEAGFAAAPGATIPRVGWRHRSSASAPTTAPSARRICGW